MGYGTPEHILRVQVKTLPFREKIAKLDFTFEAEEVRKRRSYTCSNERSNERMSNEFVAPFAFVFEAKEPLLYAFAIVHNFI